MNVEIERIFLSSEFRNPGFELDPNETTDVIVHLKNGNKYFASFFPYEKLKEIIAQNIKSGEFLSGKYFWAKGMLLIKECSRELITSVVKHLMLESDFESAFIKLN